MPRFGYLLPTRNAVLYGTDPAAVSNVASRDLLELARTAEATGFSSVWAGDSILARPRLDAMSVLAGLAVGTESIDLGTAVYLPALRHPATVAHQTATVDALSEGRLRLGVGVGVGDLARDEYEQLGVAYEQRGRVLDESLDVITGLWEGEPLDYSGRYFELRGASIGFRPRRTPPIYVASGGFDPDRGFPAPIRNRIVEYGRGWLPVGCTPDEYAEGIARAHDLLEGAGRTIEAFDAACYQDVVVANSKDEALRQAREFLTDYSYTEHPKWSELTDELIEQRGAFGPPATIRDHLERYEDAGVETFIFRFAARDQHEQLCRFEALL